MSDPMTKQKELPRIQVSLDHHFLVTENGNPFFWLGDTAWEIFHRLTLQEIELYLDNRQQKRFNVIQAVALAAWDGVTTPNAYGYFPLVDNDPGRPVEAHFEFIDEVIQMAADRGLYIGFLPTWGDRVSHLYGSDFASFNPENAYSYGKWLGARYRQQTNLIWVLGGDRPAVIGDEDDRPVWRAMAAGIEEGVGSHVLMTYHPSGGSSSSEWLLHESWLDMNMIQSSHGFGHDTPVWKKIESDYSFMPTRPTLDSEPNYEDHPVNPWPTYDPASGYYRDYDVRKQCYRSVFAGGCGVTYGNNAVWQFHSPGRNGFYAEHYWTESIDRPGAFQMQYLRALMESRPFLTRLPDQSLLISDPGSGGEHVQATRDQKGSYAFIYFPISRPVAVNLSLISGKTVQAWWYDPRDGTASSIGLYQNKGDRNVVEFTPPVTGPDWVLVLDDTTSGYGLPGE